MYMYAEKFWRISLYVTNDAKTKLYRDKKISQKEGNGRKFSHIEPSISLIR